jgi:DNA-binding winged helix-turn-helix (wHTH) protein/TolB-like protein/Tfp pilus assembly protein PilF
MEDVVEFGVFRVSPARRELLANGRAVVIGARALDVLIVLIGRAGELVTKEELLATVWAGAAVEDGAIAAQIAAVRRTLGDGHDGARWVQTVPGRGYRFVGTLHSSAARSAVVPLPATPLAGSGRNLVTRPLILALTLALGLALAASAVWVARDRLHLPSGVGPIRVAVLPFDTIGSDEGARTFADGLFDELLGALSLNQVLVVSRADTAFLRGAGAAQAIDRLGVRLLLEGVVQSDGQTLRVRMHLDDVRRHAILWSRQFEAPVQRSKFLSSDVAAHTTDVVESAASDRYGLDATGMDAPTMAAFLEAGDQMQNGSGDRFVEIFRRVVARAPNYSYAHSDLAFALMNTGSPIAARSEARRALALDPHNGESYSILANLAPEGAWREREALLLRGLTTDPDPPYLPESYGDFLSEVGRCREALAMTQRAVRAEPYWAGPNIWLPARLLDVGQVEAAQEAMARTVQEWPDLPAVKVMSSYITDTTGPLPQALAMLEGPNLPAPFARTPGAIRTWRLFAMARDTHDASLRAAAARAVNRAVAAGDLTRRNAVFALSMLGDIDGALTNSERYASPQSLRQPGTLGRNDTWVLFAGPTAAMRRDPRFIQLAGKLGLVDYWRQSGRWPDFCSEAGWPYDCRVEAARLAAKDARFAVVKAKSRGAR